MYRNIVVNTDPVTVLFLVGLPGLYLIFFGFGFGSFQSSSSSYLSYLTPGIMSFQSVMAGTVGGSVLWADKRWGMLAQLLVGPFSRLQYLLGLMFTSILFGIAGALVMLASAAILLGSVPITILGSAIMFGTIILGSIFFGSLMLLISALVKSNNTYNSIQILLIFIVNFASTVFYPLSNSLPLPIKVLFVVNPLTYIADTVRDAYFGTLSVTDGYKVALLGVETAVFLFLAVRAYMRSDVSLE